MYSNNSASTLTQKGLIEHKQCYNIVIFYNKSTGTFYHVYKFVVS